jgi:hypothetical protein
MAEEFESKQNFDLAIVAYKKAGDYFTMENSNYKSSEFDCYKKVADLMCITGHKEAFKESIKYYEKIALYYLTQNLLKGQAKDLFFKIVVLYIAYDVKYILII